MMFLEVDDIEVCEKDLLARGLHNEVVLSFNLDRKEGLRTFVSLNGNPQPNVLCTRQR